MRAHRDTDVIIVDFYFSDQRSSVTEDDEKVRQSRKVYLYTACSTELEFCSRGALRSIRHTTVCAHASGKMGETTGKATEDLQD